jgi:hypothetical protein
VNSPVALSNPREIEGSAHTDYEGFQASRTEGLLHGALAAFNLVSASKEAGGLVMVRIKLSQKIFTEDEVVSLTGICTDHLRKMAQNKHLGTIARAAEAAGAEAEKWLFSHSDLMILTVLQPRCDH